jgi:hypothetical protein
MRFRCPTVGNRLATRRKSGYDFPMTGRAHKVLEDALSRSGDERLDLKQGRTHVLYGGVSRVRCHSEGK